MQFVEIELDPEEAAVAEASGMMYMDDGITMETIFMETIFGDGSQQGGGLMGALPGAGKRLLTGESLFMTAPDRRRCGLRARGRDEAGSCGRDPPAAWPSCTRVGPSTSAWSGRAS